MIVVAHADVRPTDKGCITKDDPRFLRSGEKAPPENVKATGTSGLSLASRASAILRFRKRSVATATAEAENN